MRLFMRWNGGDLIAQTAARAVLPVEVEAQEIEDSFDRDVTILLIASYDVAWAEAQGAVRQQTEYSEWWELVPPAPE